MCIKLIITDSEESLTGLTLHIYKQVGWRKTKVNAAQQELVKQNN